jgi:hypothetical protein
MTIRVSRGVGSNPKLWATAASQVGEFDLSDAAGSYDAESNGVSGMSGIVWMRGRIAETHSRKLYASVDEWVDDIRAEYPGYEIIRADDEPQRWL